MKKLLTTFLIIVIALIGLTACIEDSPDGNGGATQNGSGNLTDNLPIGTSSVLVAYFSCTNTTKAVAQNIQTKTKGTLYQITPEVPYTADDLKYYTNCRADKEYADANSRPAISGKVENFEKYDVIFLGYPIWFSEAPRIISTFLESYDFSGKTIVPFCTSASSGLGSSDTKLHSLAPSANWIAGRRFPSSASQKSINDWINSLDLKLDAKTEQQEITKMYITIDSNKLEVTLAKNSSVDALVEKLKQGDITYIADDYGNFEKVGSLGFSLPTNNTQITTEAGDVILYSGNQIVLFYGSNSWSYTRLGKINGYSSSQLRTLLGAGKNNLQVTISLN